MRRIHQETIDEYHTSNRITDRPPPPFRSIEEPVGDVEELKIYLLLKSGGMCSSLFNE